MTWPKTLALTACCVCLGLSAAATVRAATSPGTFAVAIAVSGGHEGTFIFGMDPSATSAADTTFDVPLPPAVPGGADVTFLGAPPFSRLSTDIQAEAAAGAVWRLRVTVVAGQPITLTWGSPSGTFLADKALRLTRTSGADVNMKTTSSLTVSSTTTYTILLGDGGSLAPVASIADAQVLEGNAGTSRLEFPVELSAATTVPVSIHYTTVDGTATVADGDYVAQSGTIAFSPGETATTLAVLANGDTQIESDERFSVVLSAPLNATLIGAEGTGTIRNDDTSSGPPDWRPPAGLLNTMAVHAVVRLGDGSFVGAAGSLLAAFKGDAIRGVATLFNGPATPMQFQLSVGSNGTAESGITLKVYDAGANAVYDLTETVDFVADATHGTIVVPLEFHASGGQPSSPALTVADAQGNEGNSGASTLQFTVSLSAASAAAVTVNYATADGSATVANADYQAASGQVSFAAGETSKTITVPISGDTLVEPDETFTVTLSSPVNATLADGQATGTLRNDDVAQGRPDWQPPSGLLNTMAVHAVVRFPDTTYVSATGSLLAAFKDGAIRGVCTIFNGPATPMQFQLSVGANGTAESGMTLKVYDAGTNAVYDLTETVDFVADATHGTIVVPLEFHASGGQPSSPALAIADAQANEGNSGASTLQFAVTLSPAATAVVTVNYATTDGTATVADVDYVSATGQLTFAVGETSKTIAVQIRGDTKYESHETFTVTLSNPLSATLADGQATGTLRNDDAAGGSPALAITDAQANEGNSGASTLQFAVTLSPAATAVVTVNYATTDGTATVADVDYVSATGQLTFAVGETSRTIAVQIRGDTKYESHETFTVTLSNPLSATLADGQATGTLLNDDAAVSGPSITIQDASAAAGGSAAFGVALSAASAATVSVSYATADGTATAAGGDYQPASGTLTFAPGQTVQTVTVTVNASVVAGKTFRLVLANAVGAQITDAEGVGTVRGDGPPWYPSFALVPGDILKVTIRRNDGTLVLESQVVSADGAGQDLFEARNYRHGSGTGRTGLLPGQYTAQVAVWDQVAQQFVATGTQTYLPPVSYSTAATPAPSAMSSAAIDGSNRNWSLKFAGSVQAQGFVIELRNSRSRRAARQVVQEFLPASASATFPVGPLHEELTRVVLATGAQQWRLRFFTPLDRPGRSTAATNWSAWRDIVALTDASLDPNRQPVNPPAGERWYYPESGAMFSADAGTDTASVALSWNAVTHADSYYLHLCTSEGRVVLNRVLVSAAHYPNLTLAPGTYFWAVCPVNSALGRAGIAASWAEPFPFFTVLPGVSADPETPGEVVVTGATRLADGYLRLALSWNGRVAPTVRILVLDPGIMLEPGDDRDAAPDSYTTNELDRHLAPGTRTLVKVQGHSASGENGPWSAFVPIVIPPKP